MTTYFFITEPTKEENRVNIRMRLRDGKGVNLYGVTEERIFPEHWESKYVKEKKKRIFTHRIKPSIKFEGKNALSVRLKSLQVEIEEMYHEDKKAGKIDKKWLKTALDKHYNPGKYDSNEPRTLFEFIQYFIDTAETRPNPKTGAPVTYKQRREYNRTFQYLKEFCEKKGKEYDWPDIDLDFYQDWVEYLQDEGLAKNTVGKKIMTLKIFLNYAAEQDMPVNPKYKSHRFKNLNEESDQIYLTTHELGRMYDLDLSQLPGMDRVRDQFLIAAWTGCRYGDLSQVTRDNLKEKMIHIKQHKTGNKVWIPMHPVVEKILQKYDYEFPAMITNQKFNEALKKVAKKAKIKEPFHKSITRGGVTLSKEYKKWQLVTSHTARRSFATNLYKSGFPAISIMKITGHKTEAAFLKYIKVTPEEHARLLQAHWENGAEHLRVV